ncbi:SDR family oxidoreductase [Pseudonocardia sp. NPDC049635]|uniref:SDR family oxidoreductase n=1 Tax=Pseudonocardia sp. NPDC049635 TaxID=3155506 RepID=UPI0033E052E9
MTDTSPEDIVTIYAVTGAGGHLGSLVVQELLARGVPAGDVVAVARTPQKAEDLSGRGVQVRRGDYTDPASLRAAFDGVDRLLLVSGDAVGQRFAQHANVVDAARESGVSAIAYTSLTRADTSPLALAPEHRRTEELLAGSGLPYTVLRNNWYLENYTDRAAEYLARGEILSATGTGRIGAAARRDLAGAAAVVLTTDGHDGRTYELAGPPLTLTELAATLSEVSGRQVAHRAVPAAELVAALTAAGLDEATAGFVAAMDEAIAGGALDIESSDLADLLGRAPTPVADVLRAAL